MTKDEHATQLRLVHAAEDRSSNATERHGCYPVRENHEHAKVRLALYPVPSRGVSNVVPIRATRELPPAA